MNFWDLIGNKTTKPSFNGPHFKFVIVSGDFPNSGVALPLINRKVRGAALRELCLYKGRTLRNKLKIGFLRIFNFSFIWDLVFRKKFVVNFNPAEENLFSFFNRQLSNVNSQMSNVAFSVYVGSRKFILPIFNLKSGETMGVAKVYFPGRESFDYGENEAKFLNLLKEINLPGFCFPEVLAKGSFKNSLVVILSSPKNLKNSYSITRRHIDFLKQLTEKTGRRTLFSDSDFYHQLQEEISFLKLKLPDKFQLVEHFYNKAVQGLKDKTFTFSLVKREFPFFEMMKLRDKFFVIDWEQGRMNFPAIFDLFSLMVSAGRFKKGDYAETYRKNLEDIFFKTNKKTKLFLSRLLPAWGMNQNDAYYFFLLFLIDQLYIHLHVDHKLSAERVIAFFEKFRGNEPFYKDKWLIS